MKKSLVISFLLVVISFPAQSQNQLQSINEVWNIFYKAFSTLDANLMAKIHSKELVRISGAKKVLDYKSYISNYESQFKQARETGQSNRIELRFFERLYSDKAASERGIYKLTITDKNGKNQFYFGEFHVIFKKEADQWKIVSDYDSNTGNAIGDIQFMKASAIDDFTAFITD